MSRIERTNDELELMAREHIDWEVRMLSLTFESVRGQQGRVPLEDAAPYQALMLHIRTLCDFLSPRKSAREDDVIAADYVPGWTSTWNTRDRMRPPDYDGPTDNLRFILDKTLAHITWSRIHLPPLPSEQMHVMDDVMHELAVEFRRFTDELSAERKSWFDWLLFGDR